MRPDTTSIGVNRTGIATSPTNSAEMVRSAKEGCAYAPPGGPAALRALRLSYENEAGPVGTVPVPAALKGGLVAGRQAIILLDKLGERLAFERNGTRIYEALITKADASPGWPGGPTRADIVHFRDEELAHFMLIRDSLVEVGADPTAQTPAADVVGTASIGLVQVVTDPRTTLAQSLDALLTAELTDNDGWQMLIGLTRDAGLSGMVARFQHAQEEEAIHLASVRAWLLAAAKAGVGAPPDPVT